LLHIAISNHIPIAYTQVSNPYCISLEYYPLHPAVTFRL
jgi:hypothetical protein